MQKTKARTAADEENYKLQPEALHLHTAKKDIFPSNYFSPFTVMHLNAGETAVLRHRDRTCSLIILDQHEAECQICLIDQGTAVR